MAAHRKIEDERILSAYREQGSCKRAAAVLGLCAQSVHERLTKLGAVNKQNLFSKQDVARLERDYAIYSDAGKLDVLAREMGRTRQYLCRQAKKLGLTNRNRARKNLHVWKSMSDEVARGLFEKFRKSSLGLKAFCRRHGLGEVGFWRSMSTRFPDEWEPLIELKAPKQSKYKIGRQFEYRTRDVLRRIGFFVLRSPGSRSPLDLIAIARGTVLFVQCKRGGYCPPSEWNDLYDLAVSVGASPVLVVPGRNRGAIDFKIMTGRKQPGRAREPAIPFDPALAIPEVA